MSKVCLTRCDDYTSDAVKTALSQALDPLGGIAAFVKPGDRVLLKVNLLSRALPERAVTTHPAVVRAVIDEVRAAGGVPVVGDSPGGPNTPTQIKRVWQDSGIGAVCEEMDVPLVLFDEDTCRVKVENKTLYSSFTIGRVVADADVVITLPKFKTHGFMMFTGAVKNLFGCIPGLEKAQYHTMVPERHDFAAMLVDLMLACRPNLAIMDAVVGMEGDGPAGGTPRQIGCLIASADCLALDVVASAMAGLDPMEVYTNAVGAERGLGPKSLDEIEIVGEDWRSLAPENFELPAHDLSRLMPAWLGPRLKSLTTAKPVMRRVTECTLCKTCEKVCPVGAIVVGQHGPEFDRAKCIRCYCCQELCPPQAIDLTVPPLARMMSRRR